MSTGADREIQGWMEDWKAGEREIPAGLNETILRRVKRQSLNQKLFLAGEILTGVVMAAFLVGIGVRSSHPADLPMVILFLGLILGAFVWGIRIRRGLWYPEGHSAADFLELSLRRVRQRRKMVRAGYVILAIELAVFIPWILLRTDEPGPALTFLAAFVVAALAIMIAVARWTKRDLESLLDLRRSLEGNGGSRMSGADGT